MRGGIGTKGRREEEGREEVCVGSSAAVYRQTCMSTCECLYLQTGSSAESREWRGGGGGKGGRGCWVQPFQTHCSKQCCLCANAHVCMYMYTLYMNICACTCM